MTETQENSITPTNVQPLSVAFKKRNATARGKIRAKPARTPPLQTDDSSDSSADEPGHRIKQRKKNTGVVTTSSVNDKSSNQDLFGTAFTADRNAPFTGTNDATKQSNWFDEGLKDAPIKSFGPIKASTNIRTITVTDFAPDVCKDYKQTGFCGFGDNCKFLHAREDYKQGWQLDREWEDVTRGRKDIRSTRVASADKDNAQEKGYEEDVILDNIPFVCIICKESYKAPIVTRCGHYFCEPCALRRYRSDPSCAACGLGTKGVFNSANRLQKLLDKKGERGAVK
ncbi:MAG: hypothetical protein Q9217_006902 [Psora testacea]